MSECIVVEDVHLKIFRDDLPGCTDVGSGPCHPSKLTCAWLTRAACLVCKTSCSEIETDRRLFAIWPYGYNTPRAVKHSKVNQPNQGSSKTDQCCLTRFSTLHWTTYYGNESISRAVSSCVCFSSEVLSWRIRKLKQVFHVGSLCTQSSLMCFPAGLLLLYLVLSVTTSQGLFMFPGGRE